MKEQRQGLPLGELEAGLPLSEAVFRALCDAIRAGAYQPGDRLREEDVAQQLQVSRTPVRDAFGRLLTKRLVEPGGGRGLTVRRLDTAEVLELYTMREILEGAAARLAAQHISQPEIDALVEIEAAFEASEGTPEDMARLNRRLHGAVIRAARNRYLDHALQELQDGIALLGGTTFAVAGRPVTAAQEHREIVAAIAARDPDRAESAAQAHIRGALKARLTLIRE
ncbi:GntR family transcriptional regulator [Aquabacter cavernae]|uniref:GntR family transcriptional regulator n=1 Tax=Aquabacter cavernae TaxID=2496029 RepID=UPI000F8C3830|nr:GntR family transcriptional regulator [Aquabacter cavernae]